MKGNWGWGWVGVELTYKCGKIDLQQMSLSRFFTTSHFREQVIRSYNLHRDLKSCLSLKQAEKIVEQRGEEIKEYGKTAFLQFLNGFPLNYSYKMLNGPLKIFLFSLQLKDLSVYEEQLKYSIFNKLREFVCNADKPTVQTQIDRSEQTLTEMIKVKPFDATHAMNFLHCQKDSRNSQLFYHCLDVIRKTQYRILELVMPKFLPVFVKRLNSDEWNIIRKFEYFTDNIIFDFIPKQANAHNLIYLLDNLCKLQLHTVGYLKIPPAIDYIMGYFISNLDNEAIVDEIKLNILFSCFDYLPMGYNEAAFSAVYNKILKKNDKDPLYFDYVPYRRLSPQQSSTLMHKFVRHQFSFHSIIYIGNKAQLREEFLKTELPQELHKEFFIQHQIIRRTFFNYLITTVVLLDYYKNDRNMMSSIRQRWKNMACSFKDQWDPQNYVKFFSLANALNLMRLNSEVKGLHNQLQAKLIQDQLYRSRNEDFKQRKYHENVIEAVNLFADSPIPEIRRLLIEIILNIKRKQDKFYFQRFSYIIFKLLKSNHSADYHEVVKGLLTLVGEGECQYFVEIYNRNQGKNHKALFELLKILKKVDPSFQCMGKFMVTSSFSQYTSNRGELVLQYRKILQAIQPMLNVQQLKGYVLPQLAAVLRFCNHFYFYISEFSRKLLLVALEHAEGLNITRDGGKFLIQFIQEAIRLKLVSHAGVNVNKMCIALIKKAKEAFPDNVLLKTKEIEFLSLLGENKSEDHTALKVDEILSQLSSSNYSSKHADTMVLLLKLNCLEVIKLKEIVADKLQNLVECGLEANQIKISDVVNQLYFISKRNTGDNSQRLGKGIAKLLSLCIDKTKGKHNFEYYMQFVDFGHYLRNTDLVEKGFNCLSHPILYVHHIKRITNMLRFYRNISCDLLVQKLLQETSRNFDHFHEESAEILYTCHHIKNKTGLSQFGDTCIILDKLTALLANPQSNLKNKEAMAMKHLWVSCKINKFDPSLKPVFKIAVDSFKDVRSRCEKGNYEGIPSENIAYLYLAMLRYVEANNPSWLDDYKVESKSLFKSKTKIISSTDTIIEQCANMLRNLNKLFTEENRAVLVVELSKAGFKRKGQDNGDENVYELEQNVNQVILNGWVRKDGKQYGVMLKRDHYYTKGKQEKGRIDFTLNALSKITGTKVLLLQPGKELNFE